MLLLPLLYSRAAFLRNDVSSQQWAESANYRQYVWGSPRWNDATTHVQQDSPAITEDGDAVHLCQ